MFVIKSSDKQLKSIQADDLSEIEPLDARKENSQKLKDALAELKVTLESLDTHSFHYQKEEKLAALIEETLGAVVSYNTQIKEMIKQQFTGVF